MSNEERTLRLENAMSTLVEMLAEQQRLIAEQQRLSAEQQRLNTEQQRLNTEQQRRTSRLEESFTVVVELLRRHDERFDETDGRVDELRQIQSDLHAAQAASERRIATLADAQAHTNQKLDVLIDIVREQRNGQS